MDLDDIENIFYNFSTRSILIVVIVITLLGSITIFSYLGISFDSKNIFVLKKAAIVEAK